MRRRRMWIVLLLALISGLAAAYLAIRFLRQPQSPVRSAEAATTEVVVAARDLPLGRELTAEDVKLIAWPAEVLPAGFASSVDEVLGRGVISPVTLNEPLLSANLALEEAGGGLPISIPSGMRAVSVRVNDVVNVAGFVTPMTRVDVMLTVTSDQVNQGDPITKLILQDVLVVAAGQINERTPDGEPVTVSVTSLLVTPEEAEKLILASNEGAIQLALRNTLDGDTVQTDGAELPDLIQTSAPAPRRVVRSRPRPRPSAPPTVEVWRGPEVETTTVRSEDSSR